MDSRAQALILFMREMEKFHSRYLQTVSFSYHEGAIDVINSVITLVEKLFGGKDESI